MSNVRRVYVEKKPEFAVSAKELRHEIKHYLGIQTVTDVRVLIRYDVPLLKKHAVGYLQSLLLIHFIRKVFR